MRVERGKEGRAFESYERIYQIIDYGALTENAILSLKARGIPVAQKRLNDGPRGWSLPLYPSPEFVEKLRLLEQSSPLRRTLLESAMLSTIVATKRIGEPRRAALSGACQPPAPRICENEKG
jgi:hypothetical protein